MDDESIEGRMRVVGCASSFPQHHTYRQAHEKQDYVAHLTSPSGHDHRLASSIVSCSLGVGKPARTDSASPAEEISPISTNPRQKLGSRSLRRHGRSMP